MLVGTQMARRLEVDTLIAAGYAPEHVKQTSHSRWTSSSPYLSRVTWNLARGLRRYCRTMAVDDMVSRVKEDLEEETDSNKTYGSTNLVSVRVLDGDSATLPPLSQLTLVWLLQRVVVKSTAWKPVYLIPGAKDKLGTV